MKLTIQHHRIKLIFSALAVLAFLIPTSSFGFQQDQEEFLEYKGKVVEAGTEKPLALASITLEDSNISTISNTEGEFLLKIPKNSANGSIVVSFLGYENRVIPVQQLKKNKNKIELKFGNSKNQTKR